MTIDAAKKERSDAWGASLPEEVRWQLYDTLAAMPWPAVPGELEKRGVETPSRAGWYRFLARQRKADAARRIERIAQSVAEAQAVADKHGIKAAVFVETLKSLAIDRAMGGDDKAATSLAAAAASIWANAQREKEIDLKSRSISVQEASASLAREKFEAAEKRLERVAEIADAARGGKVDPAKVADEIDRILGRKK